MFIHKIRSGPNKQYLKLLLRATLRNGSTFQKITFANLSGWTSEKIDELEAALEARRRNKNDHKANLRIYNILQDQGLFTYRILRLGKPAKWKYFQADPALPVLLLNMLCQQDKRKLVRSKKPKHQP